MIATAATRAYFYGMSETQDLTRNQNLVLGALTFLAVETAGFFGCATTGGAIPSKRLPSSGSSVSRIGRS